MKTRIGIIIAITLWVGAAKAQDNAEVAFSKSYSFAIIG